MSRGYSIKKYQNIIENIRSLMPDASITADAIVAFPGETEQQYQDTLKLISEIGFDQVNTAAYSPRPKHACSNLDESTFGRGKKS